MNTVKPTLSEKGSFNISEWIDTSKTFDIRGSLEQGNRSLRRNVKGIWNKRLELFFGFIPALLVFIITYGKKFR